MDLCGGEAKGGGRREKATRLIVLTAKAGGWLDKDDEDDYNRKVMTKHDGGPAFPQLMVVSDHSKGGVPFVEFKGGHPGISKLDYFAGRALVGLEANAHVPVDRLDMAREAYDQAERMVEEGRKRHDAMGDPA